METVEQTAANDVVIESLSVQYPGGVLALENIDLQVSQGLFGLLGPNGAGKTTLMRTLATLQSPTSGRARVFGYDVHTRPRQVRQLLGYLPQDFQSYPQLKVWEVLDYYAILQQLTDRAARRERIETLLERVGLQPFRSRKVGQLSGGMLRRLGVAQALLNHARLLILDEPTVGLDPAERIHFRNFLADLSRERVVLLSTHIVPDIGSSCDRLAVLDRGRVRFQGQRQTLIETAQGKVWRVVVSDAEYETFRQRYPVTSMVETPEGIELRLLAAAAGERRWQAVAPNLEDAYLWLLHQAGSYEQRN